MEALTALPNSALFFVGLVVFICFILIVIFWARSQLIHNSGSQQQITTNIQNFHYHDYPPEKKEDKKLDKDDLVLPDKEDKIGFTCGENVLTHEDFHHHEEGVQSEVGTTLLRQRSVAKQTTYHDEPPPYTKTDTGKVHEKNEQRKTGQTQSGKVKDYKAKAFLEDSGKTLPKEFVNSDEETSKGLKNRAGKKPTAQLPDEKLKLQFSPSRPSTDVEVVKLLNYNVESPTEMYRFEVDDRGCIVNSPYCRLHFPRGATEHPLCIRMKPQYNITTVIEGKIFICPVVEFTSEQELIFLKNVTVSLHTTYTAADSNKMIPVQVLWRKDHGSQFQNYIEKLDHGNERFIEFSCKHFCGYSVVADETQFQNMQRHYYSAAYVRQPKNETTRFLHWLIYEDCPSVLADNRQYLSSRDTVIDPEIFPVGYHYNLQLRMDGANVQIDRNDQQPKLTEKWGSRVSESYQFRIETCRKVTDCEMQYQILAMHTQNRAIYQVIQKHFYLEWTHEAAAPSMVLHVKDNAVGVSISNPTTFERSYQQQVSNVSGTSSGYASVEQSPSIRERSFSQEVVQAAQENSQSVVMQQEEADDSLLEGFEIEGENNETVPKSEGDDEEYSSLAPRDGGFFSLSLPMAQSTPCTSRVKPESKEQCESLTSEERSFLNN